MSLRTPGLRRLFGRTSSRRTSRRPISQERYPMAMPALSNDTQRTKLHPSMDGQGWTSLAIFSKNGIIRREFSHVLISMPFVSVLVVVSNTTTLLSVSSNLIFHDNTLSYRQGNLSKCTPRCRVFQHILMYSVSYTRLHDCLFPPLPDFNPPDSSSSSATHYISRSSLEDSVICSVPPPWSFFKREASAVHMVDLEFDYKRPENTGTTSGRAQECVGCHGGVYRL